MFFAFNSFTSDINDNNKIKNKNNNNKVMSILLGLSLYVARLPALYYAYPSIITTITIN